MCGIRNVSILILKLHCTCKICGLIILKISFRHRLGMVVSSINPPINIFNSSENSSGSLSTKDDSNSNVMFNINVFINKYHC